MQARFQKYFHFFQKDGRKKIKTVYNSRRPVSISNARRSFAGTFSQANVQSGANAPNAGPQFDKQDIDAVTAVSMSIRQQQVSRIMKRNTVDMYIRKNPRTRLMTPGITRSPFSRILFSTRGKILRLSSATENFQSNMIRTHLIPPEVEPPQPPMHISPRIMTQAKDGQTAKSAVINPVVVDMETTWNNAARKAVSGE